MKSIRHMKSRVLALLLCLCLVMALLPTVAFAAGEENTPTYKPGNSWSDALSEGDQAKVEGTETGNVKLTDNIELTKFIELTDGSLTIDLNGHNITRPDNGGSTVFNITGGKLTVKGEGTVSNAKNTGAVVIVTGEDSALNVEGGIFEKTGEQDKNQFTITVNKGAQMTMTGGEIKTNKAIAVVVDDASSMGTKLTMSGGKLTGGTGNALQCQQNGAVDINSGAIVNDGDESETPVPAVVVMSGGKLDMSGGSIIGKESAIQVQDENTKVTVTDGTIENQDNEGIAAVAVVDQGEFIMNGGTIKTPGMAVNVGTTQGKESDAKEGQAAKATIGGSAIIECEPHEGNFPCLQTKDYGVLNIADNVKINGRITVFQNGRLNISGGTIEADGFAISTNGSESTGAKIEIGGSAKVTSTGNTACGVYLPAGELTVKDEAEISGAAGIVVRGGKLTVEETFTGTITATGTEEVTVGDAGNSVPPAAVAVDKNDDYSEGKVDVTVKGGNFKAAEGQPTVSYTETGDAAVAPSTGITVDGGEFKSGNSADPSVAQFVGNDKAVNAKGEVKEESEVALSIIDFGYITNKNEVKDGKYTSENHITYNASDWGDATFYWAFNRKLNSSEKPVTVTFTGPDNVVVSDTCEAEAERFASSFLNESQLGNDLNGEPITAGEYTISAKDNKENELVVTDKAKTAEVTLPESVLGNDAPEVLPAVLADDADADNGSVKAGIIKADSAKKEYTVLVEAKNLHSHENAEGKYGYWVGFAVSKPTDGDKTGFWYKFGETGEWKYSALEKNIDGKNGEGVAFYFADIKPTDVYLKWATENEKDTTPTDGYITFHVTFDVARYVAPPTGGGSYTPSATVKTDSAKNGSYTVSDKNAKAGDTVKVTPKANEGYVVDQVTVTDKNGKDVTVTQNSDGTYSFVMPEKAAQPVTVKVTFKPDDSEKDCPSEKFTDVDPSKWYHEGVDYAVKNGLMEGTGASTFAPDATTTRAMVVTILYRLDGEPAVTKDVKFGDVPAGQWYSDAINWAATNNIVDGYGNGKFGPDDSITREQMVAILYRYARYKGLDAVTTATVLGKFKDHDTISGYAVTAFEWAVAKGIIEGTSDTTLSPTGNSTRAQVATILMRYCEGIVK